MAKVAATRLTVPLLSLVAHLLAGCSSAPRATILYVTDAHEIAPVVDRHGDRGGVARLKSVVDGRRRVDPRALLVFGGDLAGGTLFGGVFRGEPMVDALGRAGVGLASFGQHDFDFGAAHAKALVERAAFPWITSNLVDGEGRPFASLPTRKLLRVGGLAVGFVGLTDDFGTTTQEGSVRQADLVTAAARESEALRREGAEAVVALTQAGSEANRRLLVEVPALNAVLTEEESETVSIVRWVGGRPVAAPCGNLGSVVELVLERRDGSVAVRVAAYPVDGSVAGDPGLAREERAWMARLGEMLAAPVGSLAEPLDDLGSVERETGLGDFVADAFREASGRRRRPRPRLEPPRAPPRRSAHAPARDGRPAVREPRRHRRADGRVAASGARAGALLRRPAHREPPPGVGARPRGRSRRLPRGSGSSRPVSATRRFATTRSTALRCRATWRREATDTPRSPADVGSRARPLSTRTPSERTSGGPRPAARPPFPWPAGSGFESPAGRAPIRPHRLPLVAPPVPASRKPADRRDFTAALRSVTTSKLGIPAEPVNLGRRRCAEGTPASLAWYC